MLRTRRTPEDIPWPDLHWRLAPALGETNTSGHNQDLPERMRVPGTARAGFECHTRTASSAWGRRFEQRVYTDRAGEIFGRSLAGWLRTVSLDIHLKVSEMRVLIPRGPLTYQYRGGRLRCRIGMEL